MKNKKILYEEIAYLLGIFFLTLGTALAEKADFGMSMVVAPAYLVHLKVSSLLPWFSFGVAEYSLQACLLIALTVITGKVKKSYFLSFVTAVFYGFVLDIWIKIIGGIEVSSLAGRVVFYILSLLTCSAGVAFLFHTYIAPEAYELIVKEISAKYSWNISKVKTVYDCISCLTGIVLSFIFFGMWVFVGVSYGTIICAICNGFLIGRFSRVIDRFWELKKNEKIYKILN